MCLICHVFITSNVLKSCIGKEDDWIAIVSFIVTQLIDINYIWEKKRSFKQKQ